MRSSWTKLGVILLIVGLTIFAYSEGWGADWKYVAKDTQGNVWQIDVESISRQPKSIVTVWVKRTYSNQDVAHWVKNHGEKFKDLSYSIDLQEYNCTEKKRRTLNLIFHSLERVIESVNDYGEWNFISPDSVAETIYKEVCK